MIIRHHNETPKIDQTAYIAPNAVICGNVTIGKNVRVMFGAQIIAENNPIKIGDQCIILENAVIRGTNDHSVSIGNNCLVGPNAHLAGCVLEDNVFIATGASIFHGALVKSGAEVRINGVVHLKTVVPKDTTVPINWIAVGNPMEIFPPEKHDEIWNIQKRLHFSHTVYGIPGRTDGASKMPQICKVMADRLQGHGKDRQIDEQ